MFSKMPNTSNLLYTMLVAVLFSFTSCKKEELYTNDECIAFKKGDTVFTKEFYTIKIGKTKEDAKAKIIETYNLSKEYYTLPSPDSIAVKEGYYKVFIDNNQD